MRKTFRMRRLVLAASLALSCVFAPACGAPPPPPKTSSELPRANPAIDHDGGVDVTTARKLLARAEQELSKKSYKAAKRLIGQAEPFADETVREEIRVLRQKLDETVAAELSPPVLEQAKSGACQQAAEAVALIAKAHKGTTVVRFVREQVSKPILDCLLKQLEIDVSVARDLAEIRAVKTALTRLDYQQWDAKLDETIVGAMVETLQEPLERRAWAAALEKLDELVERKEAGAREVSRVMRVVRAGVTDDVMKRTNAGIGSTVGAGTLLRDVDALLAFGRWTEEDPIPEVLKERREEAAMWSICASQGCSLVSPEPSWAYGKLEPRPVLDLAGKPGKPIKHARKVWRLTGGQKMVLIADRDPGALDGVGPRISAAVGWVPAGSLSSADTAERLPPTDSIVGTRVWGPLRGASNDWEVGVVRDVKGAELVIERVSDGKSTSLQRGDVRFGTLRPGTKVLALCVHPIRLEPAEIDKFIPMVSGDPHLLLTCLDSKGERTSETREVLLGSLRSRAAWIPQSN